MQKLNIKKVFFFVAILSFFCSSVIAQDQEPEITKAEQINPTSVELYLSNGRQIIIDFYGDNIFRFFNDSLKNEIRPPHSEPPAQILVNNPRRKVTDLNLKKEGNTVTICSPEVAISFDKQSTLFTIKNLVTNEVIVKEVKPIEVNSKQSTMVLKEHPNEYFYGGGVQNGRFSHKGEKVAIVNENSWTDDGVASPNPFYWSTKGYGLMWFTFEPGEYDFGSTNANQVILTHKSHYLDVFFMVDDDASHLLQDYYQLTGNPVLLPKFGFYEGHLNAYNRDYWKQDSSGILFEDGKRYVESQKDNGGIKESLNGENNNYQFSARAVIDRYAHYDMPLGWILPNDGYGAGYGQTGTLDSNIANLAAFGEYARKHGVQLGLWTESNLHPQPGVEALLQRDIVKEIRDAGVRVLKTDVAWVGAGYSFGLNGISDVAGLTSYYGNNARPFIISVDGWAGTQRYATVWSGDQTGGQWEYIRFHIPTFIGAGLSGEPNITSDMDGIFGGGKPIINARGYEWKTFTPMQLDMDGWGANPKYPHIFGEPITSINRTYLKLKSELLPYTYSIAHEAVTGLPMIRAMFLSDPNAYTLGKATKYQFMYGPYFLVAPIYQNTNMDEDGNDVRNNIYLPEGKWVDYFTGQQYTGNKIINSYDAPIWKLPVLVKRGAIIPMYNPNNNVTQINKRLRIYEVYPYGHSSFTVYNDDGKTLAYKGGEDVTTLVESSVEGDNAIITINPTEGNFNGFVKEQKTVFRVNVTKAPKQVKVNVGGKKQKLEEVHSLKAFKEGKNVYFYNEAPDLNKFATPGSDFAKVKVIKNPQVWVKIAATDVTENGVKVDIKGYVFDPQNRLKEKTGDLTAPAHVASIDSVTTAYTIGLNWDAVENADYYEIKFDGMLYSTIQVPHFQFSNLQPEQTYSFKLRAVNKSGVSDWSQKKMSTRKNPLEFAIKGIVAKASFPAQGGRGIQNLVDFEESNIWHTKYDSTTEHFNLVFDLKSINTLDKIEYLPRHSGVNGMFLQGEVYYSMDKSNWTSAGTFKWKRNHVKKIFTFDKHPNARYVKVEVNKNYGGYGSGRELYIFKVQNTESRLPGDVNQDHEVDANDLTSYVNYTGLRKGDAEFDG
ncbi:MAG TPA: TIM-barrel domain-containing protein, partial [Chitinophagaceae bacterium]|nr:TIM-barrel domain-containing protein [Chitinophagaceae bacterium]